MTDQRPPTAVLRLTRQQRDRAIARADYLALERDLYRRHGPTAIHYLDDDDRRQLARAAKRTGWKRLARDTTIATVRTLRKWFKKLIENAEAKHHGGKAPISLEIVKEVIRMALDNSRGNDPWGRERIRGELEKLKISISSSSVRNILKKHGIPPAPRRGRGRDEPTVIIGDISNTVAIDFAHAYAFKDNIITLMCVLVAIHIPTRRATVIGINANPKKPFMAECARKLIDFATKTGATGFLMDLDKIFNRDFRKLLADSDRIVSRIDYQCPWQNGYAERFVGTIKFGLFQKAIFMDVFDLEHGHSEFIAHYVTERPHQGLGNRLIEAPAEAAPATGPILCRERLGGILRHYYRPAA